MHLFLFIILAIVFFSINGMIIASDMKYKKIPNRELLFLLLLLPVFYAYVSVTRGFPVEMTALLLQVFVSVLLSFLLYYYGVWSAGDAKYLLILSLYLPSTGIIPFAGNLALVTVAYLLGYYVYFYGKLFLR